VNHHSPEYSSGNTELKKPRVDNNLLLFSTSCCAGKPTLSTTGKISNPSKINPINPALIRVVCKFVGSTFNGNLSLKNLAVAGTALMTLLEENVKELVLDDDAKLRRPLDEYPLDTLLQTQVVLLAEYAVG
jgi:hypothetical protein